MRLRTPLAALAVGALALTAACGGTSGSSGGSQGKFESGGSQGSAKDATAKGPAPAVANATSGGTVTVLAPSPDTGPATLDPTAGWSVTGNSILQDLVERSLTTFRANPKTGDMELVPDLATDLGKHNADFTQWTFTLKSGLKYDNGKPITAKDIAWAIDRSFDGNNGTTGGGIAGAGTQYSAQYFLDGDKYNGPYDKTTKGQTYKGVTVSGNTITIKMARPFPDMDYWGSFAALGPVPTGAVSNPPKYGLKPWATGPYKVASFQPEKQLVLVKNTQWDPNSDPARHQYVDKWVFKFNGNANTTDQLMLSNNKQSQTTLTTATLAANYAKAKQKLGSRLVQGSSQCTAFWMPDMTKITNLKVRQAIGYAYPYQDALTAAGEVVGVTRVQGNAIEPPGMVGRKEYDPVKGGGKYVTYDPSKAKELLKEAGVKPGSMTLSWVYKSDDPQAIASKNQIAKALQGVGFKTNPLPYGGGSLYDVWTADPKGKDAASKLRAKTNIEGTAWCADWPSALTFLPPLIQSNQTYNTGKFSEAKVDARIKEIPSLPASQQAGAWADLDQEVEQDYYPLINLGYINNLMAVGSKIGNFHNDGEIGAPDYRGIYVKK